MMPFFHLFIIFFRIGIFGFGGGYAMLPLIFQSIQDFGIMTASEFSRLVALSQVTPGPIAVNAATYVGFSYSGLLGALFATIGVTLPCFLLVLITMHFMKRFQESQILESFIYGIRPATVGLICSAVLFLAENSLVNGAILSIEIFKDVQNYINVFPCIFFLITIILSGKFKISPIKLTILAGVAGALLIR